MSRNDGHVETIRRRRPEIKDSNISCLNKPLLWRAGVVLLLVSAALQCLALRGVFASALPPVPDVIRIDASQPRKDLEYRLSSKLPQEIQLELSRGSGDDWRFVYFDKLPNSVEIKVKADPKGYEPNEVIKPENWYWFKTKLPLVLEIKQSLPTPLTISFWFGSPNIDTDRAQAKQTDPDGMREFAANHMIKPDSDKQFLKFSWDAPSALTQPTQAQTQSAITPVSTPTPKSAWDAYLDDYPILASLVLLVGFILIIVVALLLLYLLYKLTIWLIKRIRDRSKRDNYSPLDSLNMDAGKVNTPGAGEARQTFQAKVKTFIASEQPTVSNKKRPGAEEDFDPSLRKAVPLPSQDGKRLDDLETKVLRIETDLGEKVGRRDNLTEAARADVRVTLGQLETDILKQIETKLGESRVSLIKKVEEILREKESSATEESGRTERRITQVEGKADETKQLLEELLEELAREKQRSEERLDELQKAFDVQTADSFYAKTLGTVFGQVVEELRDGNFERVMGERLNEFFRNGVARGEGLQELRERAEGINAAFKEVSSQMARLNPKAADEASPHLQRAAALVNELSSLQAQLQDRRGDITTAFRIPVSMHPGARQTFLDELGRGIRREIDKLNDPESYFEGELERLITADLISVVDICDKKVAPPPGSRPELEAALKQLFERTDLSPILPRQGEPFKTAEHDLIEMSPGGGGQSLTVAHVSTRGFHYKRRDNKTLLRKAGVVVYR